MAAKIIQVYFTIDRSGLGLPPLTTTGYVVKAGRKAQAFNRYGQPVDMKIKRDLFTAGKTVVGDVELRRSL